MRNFDEIETMAKSVGAKLIVRAKLGLIEDTFDLLKTMSSEGLMRLTENGISSVVVDPAHVAMIGLSLDRHAFESYSGEPGFEFAIDFEEICEVLRLASFSTQGQVASRDDIALLTIEEKDPGSQSLNMWTQKMHAKWSLPGSAGFSYPKIPNLGNNPFFAEFDVRAVDLLDAVYLSTGLQDYAIFQMDGTDFKVSGETDTVEASSYVKIYHPRKQGPARTLIPSEYLVNPLKLVNKTAHVHVKFGNNYPMIFDFPIDPESVAGLFMPWTYSATLYVAPRIESEE